MQTFLKLAAVLVMALATMQLHQISRAWFNEAKGSHPLLREAVALVGPLVVVWAVWYLGARV